MTAQTYTIQDCKTGSTTKDSYGDYQNYGLSLAGIGEPVKYTLSADKPAPMKGDTIYGELEEFEANGRTYLKLRACPKPETAPMTTQEYIMSQWAIGQAVQVYLHTIDDPEMDPIQRRDAYSNIETEAKHFYQMITRIREEQ